MTGTMNETCWADPLTQRERAELARKLAHASKRFWGGQWAFIGKLDSARSYIQASSEMQELHLDVTERAAWPPPAEAKERAMTTKPTVASVTAILTRAGFPLASGIGGGIKVRPMEGGVICVDYDPGSFPVSKDDALAAIAGLLSAEGWMVTDAGRVLVSGG